MMNARLNKRPIVDDGPSELGVLGESVALLSCACIIDLECVSLESFGMRRMRRLIKLSRGMLTTSGS